MSLAHMKRYVADILSGGLTCRESVEMVTDYLEAALPFSDRVRLHLHLGICLGCHIYMYEMMRMLSMLPVEPIWAAFVLI